MTKPVQAWKTFVCYIFGGVFAKWLSGFAGEKIVRLTVMLLYLSCMLLEFLILPYFFGQLTHAAVSGMRNVFAVSCVGIVIYHGVVGIVKSMKKDVSLQERTIRHIQRIHDNACIREIHSKEVLCGIIDQLVRWRLQAKKQGVTLSIDCTPLRRTLETPPPGYDSLSGVLYNKEATMYGCPVGSSLDISNEMFAGDDYGFDHAHAISAATVLEDINHCS